MPVIAAMAVIGVVGGGVMLYGDLLLVTSKARPFLAKDSLYSDGSVGV